MHVVFFDTIWNQTTQKKRFNLESIFHRAVKKPESNKNQTNTSKTSIFQNPEIKVKINLRVTKSGVFDFSAVPDLPVLGGLFWVFRICRI